MTAEEITPKLAALMYYSSQPRKDAKDKPISFEKIEEDQKKPFISLAEAVLSQIDQLNFKLIPKAKVKNEAEIEALLKSRIESTVRDFFNEIRIWKKDLIPQQELVSKLYQIWATF